MMKKSVLYIGVIIILMSMLCVLTGCGSNNKESSSKVEDIKEISDKYVFISKNGNDYELRDLTGKLVLALPKGHQPKSKVINGYFFMSEAGSTKLKLYNIDGNEVYANKDLAMFTAYKGDKIEKDNYVYLVRVEGKTETINGTEDATKMYSLSDNLKDVTDDYVYGDNASNMKSKYQAYATMIVSNPSFVSNPKQESKYEYSLKENNGFFTHMKDGKQLYEPIKGEAILNEGTTLEVLAKIDNKYYIISENGNKKEISYIPDNTDVSSFYDGYIVTKSSSSIEDIRNGNFKENECHLYDPNGNEIEFK